MAITACSEDDPTQAVQAPVTAPAAQGAQTRTGPAQSPIASAISHAAIDERSPVATPGGAIPLAGGNKGEACGTGNPCNAAFTCVDGVCCTTACAGGINDCQACSIAAGGTSDGDCLPSLATYQCGTAGSGACDLDDFCNGTDTTCPNLVLPAATTCRLSAGVCDVPETCDGSSPSCPADGFASSSTVCRSSTGGCDPAENCTGSSATCPADVKSSAGTVCRASTGVCDPAETCNGSSGSCPADAKSPAGTVCRAAAGTCDVQETCDGSSSACPADVLVSGGTTCRAAAGPCDVAETCSGSSATCPADVLVSGGTTCRASAGACDIAETCSGTSASCPSDTLRSAGFVCRAAVDTCDVQETCSGTSASCPADALRSASFTCRPAAGLCDIAENCTGSSTACPADVLVIAGTTCRAVAGVCDVAESCSGSSAACPTDVFITAGTVCRATAGVCDVQETCTGSAAACPIDAFVSSSTVCRAAADVCDAAENCTGSSASCPADLLRPSSFTCRASAGICDVAENCTGSSINCPVDSFLPSSTTCRVSAGVCDTVEHCTGVGALCPSDSFLPASTVCRPVSDVCDVAENCTGSTATCPTNGFQPSTTVCRASADQCDAAELCTGSGASCPSDIDVPNGTGCDDADACTANDTCQVGVCTAGPPAITATPNPVAFPATRVGETATDIDVTLSNIGNASLTVTDVASSLSVFPITAEPTWPISILPGGGTAPVVTVDFVPTTSTSYSGSLTVSVTGCPSVTVPVTGVGQIAGATVTPSPFDFGEVRVDGAGVDQDFTLQNTAQAPFTVSSITIGDTTNFTLTMLGGITFPPTHTLSPGQTLSFRVHAQPSDVMMYSTNVTVMTDIPGMPTTMVPLSVTGVAPDISADRLLVDFGGVDIQGAPAQQDITISNSGSAPLVINSVALSGPATHYSIVSAPAPSTILLEGTTATVTVQYAPTMEAIEPTPEHLDVVSNALSGATLSVELRGHGTDRHISVSPLDVDFGQVLRNDTGTQTVTIANNMGEAPLFLGQPGGGPALVLAGTDPGMFTIVNPPDGLVMQGSPAQVMIEFTPTMAGNFSSDLYIYNDDSDEPMAMVTLHGAGFLPPFTVNQGSLSAGAVPVDVTRVIDTPVTLTNMSADTAFTVTKICVADTGSDQCATDSVFAIVGGAPENLSVPSMGSQQVRVQFTPKQALTYQGRLLVFIEDDPEPELVVTLDGLGIDDVVLEGGGCGCRAARRGEGTTGVLVLVGLTALLVVRRRRRGLLAIAILLGVGAAGAARAEPDTAFDLQVFRPAPAGASSFITVERPSVPRNGELGIALFVDYAKNPLLSRRTSVPGEDAPVSDRTAMSLVATYGLKNRFELGVVVPVLQQSGSVTMTGVGAANGTVLGDVALTAKAYLFKVSRASLAASAALTVPTGDDTQYAGSPSVTALGRGILGLDFGAVRMAANVGVRIRAEEARLAGVRQGHELDYGVGAGVRMARGIDAIGEVYGAAALTSSDLGSLSPLEAIAGVRWWVGRSFAVTTGAGGGLVSGVGASDVRVFVGLSYSPRGEAVRPLFASIGGGIRRGDLSGDAALDDDHDGVPNGLDKCPDKAEDVDKFADDDGCPDPDNDGDLIPDASDKCPNVAEDVDGTDDQDGCVDADDDGDGVPDVADKCPKEQEDKDGYLDNDGCDDPDNDHDGIPDVIDGCALEPETINGNNDDDGCPDEGDSLVLVSQGRIEVLEAVAFTGDATLKPTAKNVLKQVAATLRANPQVAKLRINAYVDKRDGGSKDYKLSQKRGEAVRKFLVDNGVEPERLEVKPFGSERPLDARGSRDINDRIEFVITEESKETPK